MSQHSAPTARINSAARLRNFLLLLLKLPAEQTLCRVLLTGMGFVDHPAEQDAQFVIKAYSLIHQMLADYEREIHYSGMNADDANHFLEVVPRIAAGLSPFTCNSPSLHNRAKLDAADIERLENARRELRKVVDEVRLDPKTAFVELKEAIVSALDAVQGLDIPETVQDFISSRLLDVKFAIDHYEYRGINGVHEAIAGYYGSLEMARATLEPTATTAAWSSLGRVLTAANALLKAAHENAWVAPYLLTAGEKISQMLHSL